MSCCIVAGIILFYFKERLRISCQSIGAMLNKMNKIEIYVANEDTDINPSVQEAIEYVLNRMIRWEQSPVIMMRS